MHLVYAARDDVATIIVQEDAIYEFDRNMSKSGGQGPSVPEHAAKYKSQQTDVAVDFVNIRDNLESVRMQAAEANNPTSYLPKKNGHFKPTMSNTKHKKTDEIYICDSRKDRISGVKGNRNPKKSN